MGEVFDLRLQTMRCERRAMGTAFELTLVGDDPVHLRALGTAALNEVSRLEEQLSFFEARSELARINREAWRRSVRVDVEVFEILESCGRYFESTDGFFDVLRETDVKGAFRRAGFAEEVELDAAARSVRFRRPGVAINLGGYAKGYAIERVAGLLGAHRVEKALLNGGTSSVLGMGRQIDGRPWRVRVRVPMENAIEREVVALPLENEGFSVSSGPRSSGPGSSGPGVTCVVLASTALEAEVCSTAFVAMGRERTERHLRARAPTMSPEAVCWIDRDGSNLRTEWILGHA